MSAQETRTGTAAASRTPEYILDELLIRLNYHYAGDIGVFAPLFMNHFVLQPGEACFLAPNEPHAYLYGGMQTKQ